MCSKINPPDAELCAHCGARLKPILPQPGQEADPMAEEPQGGDAGDDWLSSLRLGNKEEQPAADKTPPAEPDPSDADMPDWLSRIRERARVETSEPEDQVEPPGEDPDWMNDLRGETAEPAGGSTADLISRLPGTMAEEDFHDEPSSSLAQETQGEEEWVNKLSAWQTGSANEPREVESLPEWMNDDLAATPTQSGEGDFSDWIRKED